MNQLPLQSDPQPATCRVSKQALMRIIREGLNAAGIKTRTQSSTIHFGSNPVMGVRFNAFQPELGLWRVTCGYLYPGSCSTLINPRELTLHQSDIGADTGANLVHFMTEPGWAWPTLADDPSYPKYAWSVMATRVLQADQRRRANIFMDAILGRRAR
jgi:hypothetical protein